MSEANRGTGAGGAERGSILVYVALAVPVTLLAILGTAAVVVSTSRHQVHNRSSAVAIAAIRDKIADIQHLANTDMGQLYGTYTGSGRTFDVPPIPGVRPGLTPPPGRTHVGTVLCWNDETGANQPVGARAGDSQRLGLPLDLNMDDDDDDQSLLGFDMKVVPLKVTLDFVDAAGPRHIEVFYLATRQPQ